MEPRREMCLLVDFFWGGHWFFTKPIPSRYGVFTFFLFDFKGKSREIHTIHGLFGTCMARDHEIAKIFGGIKQYTFMVILRLPSQQCSTPWGPRMLALHHQDDMT